MRSLIVRFLDCEGPGILESSLRNANYKITYHDAYKKGIQLVPESQQIFDIIVLMGGPQAVYDPKLESFFYPYLKLVENALSIPGKKVLGICLGSQIIAKALGSKVEKGKNGPEVGFSNVSVSNSSHPIFSGISSKQLTTFHLHGDTFDLPQGSERLLASEKYENQMFSYKDKAIGIQCHFEVTYPMLEVWWNIHKEIPSTLGKISPEIKTKQQEMEANARILFDNILKLKAN
ncbi:MAG TPA: type 1 glutamine amidotransferase [Leptospiraceae bacterium]|nr:type 1 glutamine amidotransferase [Leptospiraceae bacterium]HMW07746.1 type 1 glutamine amidotransferase [Leptospiraceae bacterium]HMX31984.1 type 1 glutamine amidotransferase [Leptospiraceae bacterium]HMY33412.1 type 1 glutamine amidotransferase [Leptospiraceae bacterium]HMZ64780.1 type 1 glutamine amidotransferase [Leptospiraceae bacterium]